MSERQEKYFLYQVTNDTTLTDIVNEKNSIFGFYKGKIQDLLLITYNGINNSNRIYNKYTLTQQLVNSVNKANNSLDIVNSGTELVITEDKVPIDLFSISGKGIFLEQNNLQSYLTDAYKTIQNDPNNVATIEVKNGQDTTQLKTNYISVWVYSKALNQIIDVTKFVTSLNTSSNISSGGSFNLSLEGITELSDSFLQGEEIINLYKVENMGDNPTPMSYFMRWFQQKDIVWIRWEKLELETKRKTLLDSFNVDKSQLKGQVYDMIGLIESVNENVNFSSLNREVSIAGKDLMFLLSEDAAYFYPLMFALGSDAVMYDTQDNSKLFKRNVFKDGIFESFFTFEERSISDSIGFVINQLSNLGIVDSSLFSGYQTNNTMSGNRLGQGRKQALNFKGTGKEDAAYISWQEVNGIWQIIDIFVDSKLDNRRQVDSLLQSSQGTLLGMMQSICQDPFVEFVGDTFGDKYVFFARQKIWTKDAIQSFLRDNVIIEIDSKDVISQNLDWETEFYTSYEIQPNSSFLGYDKFTAISYVPVVFLSKIGEIFGNKPYVQADSYIDERSLVGDDLNKGDVEIDPFSSAVIDDLGYLIEINSYLPFTRMGTIVINGDRRIKKGTWIYYKPTNEIYYVNSKGDSGSWSGTSVDRTSILSVERGMIRDYVIGKTIKNDKNEQINVSYFNIIDSEVIKTQMKQVLIEGKIVSDTELKQGNNVVQTKIQETKKATFDVNLDVFNFFLQRKQFN